MSDHPPDQVGSKLLLGTLIERLKHLKRYPLIVPLGHAEGFDVGEVLHGLDELEAALATLPQHETIGKRLEQIARELWTDAIREGADPEGSYRLAQESQELAEHISRFIKPHPPALPPAPPQEQEPALCGAQCGHLSCDREAGHDGNHRGYNAQIDEPMFWPSVLNEHAGGSLNGPSRLGASPNTDTGGECVLVPRSLVVAMVNLCDVTKLGLHGTPWAQSELKALQAKLESRLAASLPAQEQEP